MRGVKVLMMAGMCLAGVVLTGCPPTGTLPPLFPVADGLAGEYLAVGLEEPSALAGTDDGRVYITERTTGRIRVLRDGVLLEEPFAQVPVNHAGERGLLSVTVHPRFADNGRVYVFYTRSDDGTVTSDPQAVLDHRVVYFAAQRNDDGELLDVAEEGEVFVASLPVTSAATRIGGRIGFAHDRSLYVALGDQTDTSAAQDPAALLGKILRYTDAGQAPDTNPVAGSPIYASGFREPIGLTFDPDSRVPFVLERSANGVYEINRILPNGNYGWPAVVGIANTAEELEFAQANDNYVNPLLDTGNTQVALVGASFNPSTKYGPQQLVRLGYADALRQAVYSLPLTLDRTAALAPELFVEGFPPAVTDIFYTPSGTLFLISGDAILRVQRVTYGPSSG